MLNRLGSFKENAPVITLKEAHRQPEDFWTSNRPEEAVKKNPNSVKNLMAKLRSVPVFYVTEKVVTTLVSGYIDTNKDPLKSKFEFGPMNTTISGNSIEGARFRWEEQRRSFQQELVFRWLCSVWYER